LKIIKNATSKDREARQDEDEESNFESPEFETQFNR
jgi:hypothetical protein